MFEDYRENIYEGVSEYLPITFISNKFRVGIIGGGNAALIKLRYFVAKKANIEILAKDFIDEINNIKQKNIKRLQESYSSDFIKDKHLIIIAINDIEVIKQIKKDCEMLSKIYISTYDFQDGMGMIPVTRESENMIFSLNSKCGNPKGTLMASREIERILHEYDEFVGYSAKLRNNIKSLGELKKELLDFLISEDYRFFYSKNREEEVLKLFYNEEIIDKIFSRDNQEEQ